MERRRIREVLERYRSASQRAVACVSTGTVNIQQPSGSRPDEFMFVLNNRESAAISRDLLLQVFFVVDIGVIERRSDLDLSPSIVAYSYTVLYRPNTEVVAYHWHPESATGSIDPHAHFGPASARPNSAIRPGDLHKVHFPTGIVSLADVVRLVIEEFGVEPRRSDWREILNDGVK